MNLNERTDRIVNQLPLVLVQPFSVERGHVKACSARSEAEKQCQEAFTWMKLHFPRAF
jgi:hypothetical protein